MAIRAATGVLEAKLSFQAELPGRVAPDANAHLVHALVQPLHAGFLAGGTAMAGGIFSGDAAVKPERRREQQGNEDKQG